jgi:hypothetical protein
MTATTAGLICGTHSPTHELLRAHARASVPFHLFPPSSRVSMGSGFFFQALYLTHTKTHLMTIYSRTDSYCYFLLFFLFLYSSYCIRRCR